MAEPAVDLAATLAVEGLDIAFAGTGTVVHSLSFEVAPGEVVALVGESGSGKSVTAKAVLGLLPDTATVSGRIRVNGADVLGLDEHTLRHVRGAQVAMVFQEPSTALNPVETIGWQLTDALRAHHRMGRAQARSRAIELLGLVELPEPEQQYRRYPHQLSGGQKQRVVIALALANEPDLIIADEPTTALDVTVQAGILRLLHDLRARLGTAVLLITHNMGVVADLADRVVVLRDGVAVERGEVDQIFERPAAPYTQQLLAAVPRLAADAGESPADTAIEATPSAAGAVVSFTDLIVEYPGRLGRPAFTAIDGVTLDIAPGEVLGLVGESGSGKSTLGRTALGLLRPKSGQAVTLDHDLTAVSRADMRALRRRMGMVFQDPAASLDPRRSVRDAIGEPLLVHRAARGAELAARVDELLDAVRLPASFANRRPGELSGGQRQRVGLARALALHPDVVVADEPTSALDVSVQAAVLALFRGLQTQFGFACLFISHDLAVVDEVSHRVAVLRRGELVEVGSPDAVLRRPRTDYTRRLVDAVPLPDPAAQRARRVPVA